MKLSPGEHMNETLLLFSGSVMSDSLRPHGLWRSRLICPPLSPGVCTNSHLLSQRCYLTISSSATCFSFGLQSFLATGSSHQVVKVLELQLQHQSFQQIKGWFPLGLTGLISLQSRRLSRVFSSTTIQKYQFFGAKPLYDPTFTSIRDYWKNHSSESLDLCQESYVSAF